MKEKAALAQAFDYYDAVVKSDINRADGVSKNPERVKRPTKSFARNQGGQVPNTSIRDDIMANDAKGVNEYTVASYIAALKKIFVIEDMPAWNPNLRSKTSIRSSDTRYYMMPAPSFMMIVVGVGDFAYRREDGIFIVPVGCLKF